LALDAVFGSASAHPFFPTTELLFSLLLGFAKASTSACNAVLSFRSSDR